MYKDYKNSDPFDNNTIEIGDAHEGREEEMGGDHHKNQHDPQQS